MLIVDRYSLKIAAKIAAYAAVLLISTSVQLPAQAIGQPLTVEPLQEDNSLKQRRTRRPRRFRPRPPRRLPPNQVQPGGGLDAAVQACMSQTEALTALVPVENPVYTASAHPTFLFYLPDTPESIQYAEFILLSADEKEQIYATQFVPDAAGIVSVSLPEAGAGLALDQPYHWYLNVHCQTVASVPSVNGWVQRVAGADVTAQRSGEMTARPNSLSSTSNAVVDTAIEMDLEGDVVLPELWYDAIAQTAASIRSMQANGDMQGANSALQAQWSAWLTAAGLDDVIGRPIVGPVNSTEVSESHF